METRRAFCRRAGLLLAGLSSLHSPPEPEGDSAVLEPVNLTVEASYVLFELHAFRSFFACSSGPSWPSWTRRLR
jgi:hypothetical protein